MKKYSQNKTVLKKTELITKPSKIKEGIILSLIFIVTLFLFSPTFKYDFVNWDDDVNLTNNSNILHPDQHSIHNIFTQTIIGGYTPLTTLSFAVEHKYKGLEPAIYHIDNVILHLICTALVYFLLRQLGMNLFVSALTALLFGLHPMRVESVAWVTERKDVLYAMFFLISAIAYIAYRKTKNLLYFFLSLLIFILSLLSKIQAVSLPLALISIDLLIDKKFEWKRLLNKIPFFILSLVTGLVGVYFLQQQGSLDIGESSPFFQRIFIGTYTLVVYLIKALVPYEMSAIYPFPVKLTFLHYASLPFVAALVFLVWKIKKYRIEIIAGLLFFLFNIVFMLQFVGAGQGYMADRFTYIPYIGLFFILAFLLDSVQSDQGKVIVWATLAIYVIALVGITNKRIKVWENSETLFSDVLVKYPKVAVAYNNMGRYYRTLNQYDKAIASYTKAIEINPDGYLAYGNRGKAYFDTGKSDEALADLNKSLSIKPDVAEILSNRGAVLASKSKYKEAIADLDKSIKLDPRNTSAYSNRALAYYYLKDFLKSIYDINAYLQILPDDADMINIRALCYSQLNKYDEALNDYNRSIELNPEQGIFYQNRSFFYNQKGDKKNALDDILKAKQLGVEVNPNYLLSLQNK